MRSQLKIESGIFFLPHWDLNHGPLEQRARVLPISYADPSEWLLLGPRFTDVWLPLLC